MEDLPMIVHQLQIIILGSMIENEFTKRFMGQKMQPNEARIQAMACNAHPLSPEDARRSIEAYHTAIRIWKASKDLSISWHDNRKMDADTLIMAGL
jgi:hypothetical protein